MLTKFKVNGFKSLNDFTLSLSNGLNVLIGPNGAGKSNICQAIALLGSIANNELIEYILFLGGTKNIFKMGVQSNLQDTPQSFSIKCSGKLSHMNRSKLINLTYDYELSVEIGKELRIISEKLKINRVDDGKRKVIISIKRNARGVVSARTYNDELAGPRNSSFFDDSDTRKNLKISMESNSSESFFEILGFIYFYVHLVRDDFRRLKIFNIDPHVAKKTSDILEPMSMLSDGRRLANAIYELEKKNASSLTELNSFMASIMPRYKEIESIVSDGGHTRSFSITDVDDIKFPAQSLSDGTVKTIAFLVGMLECDMGSAIIEEPENYLHPWACNSLITYIRDTFSGRSCILTTHSETILNGIKPSELIICTNVDGYTRADRFNNSKELEKLIELSGFGCGYHYLSGALGGTPI